MKAISAARVLQILIATLVEAVTVTFAVNRDLAPTEEAVYHRLESPTQSPEVAALQQATGEIWGTTSFGGIEPAVKAYRGPLPTGARGIEFVTGIPPTSPHGRIADWRVGRPGISVRIVDGKEYAILAPVVVTLNTQTLP